ncbi:MAG: M56 family metallopeptidase [Saprospiraceae bacterium]
MPYLLHVALLLALCYISYVLLLKKETFYQLNRSILLASMIMIFLLPLLHVPPTWSLRLSLGLNFGNNPENCEPIAPQPVAAVVPPPSPPVAPPPPITPIKPMQLKTDGVHLQVEKEDKNVIETGTIIQSKTQKKISSEENKFITYINSNWSQILIYGYLLGILIFGLNFLIQCIGLLFMRLKNPMIKDGKFTIVELSDDRPPFSFFNHIFINPTQYEWETYEQILEHEKIHAAQKHSLDILLAEVLKIAQWFNPFAWWYRRAVEDNLEYLTDSVMLHRGTRRESYQMNLLKVAVPHHPLTLGTNYNQSTLKQRIKMMNIKKSSLASSWKYLFLLPVLGLSILTLNDVTAKDKNTSFTVIDNLDKKDKKKDKDKDKTKTKDKSKAKADNKTPGDLELGNIEYINVQEKRAKILTRDGKKINFQHNGKGLIYNQQDTFKVIIAGDEGGVIVINEDGFKMRVSGEGESGFININEEDGFKMNLSEGTDNAFIDIDENGFKMEFSEDGEGGFININEQDGFKMKLSEDGKNFIKIDKNGFKFNFDTDDDDDSGSFNFNSNDHPDLEDAYWRLKVKGDKIHISISQNGSGHNWMMSRTLPRSEFPTLPEGDDVAFDVSNESGKITFMGDIQNGKGEGELKFEPNEEFRSYLESQGFTRIKDNDMFHFVFIDMNRAYIQYLKDAGFNSLSTKDLRALGHHDIGQKEFKRNLKVYADYGFNNMDIDDMIQFHIHDVTPEYIRGLRDAGFDDLDTRDIVQFAIHDVDAAYITEIRDAGFTDLGTRDIIQFAIHDVDARYAKEIADYGFADISNRDIIQFAIHDVDGDFVTQLRDMGYDDLSTNEIVQFAIHDVDARYIQEIRDNGFADMSANEIVQFAIHDVDTDFIKDVRDMGYTDLSDRDIVQFAIHDVDARYIREIREAGFTDISARDIVQFSIHDVDTGYLKELRDLGFNDLDTRDVIQFAIHDVDARFVAEMKDKGYDNLSSRDLTQLSIHDVDSNYINNLEDVGYKNVDVRDLIQMKIHGVDARFVQKMQDRGYENLSPRDLIDKKIHGYGKGDGRK